MAVFKYLVTLLTVALTVASSLLLNYAANGHGFARWFAMLLVLVVIVINAFKFLAWGYLHKRFDLSKTYPLTAIFFPIIFIISCFHDEANFTPPKLVGVSLILVGLIIFETKNSR
jgi:multidrug transporter EmrE-like cation transporter